jgi:hypothetical protein
MAIGFNAIIISYDNSTETYVATLESPDSISTIYIPADSLEQVPRVDGSAETIKGKPEGTMTIITSSKSDRTNELVDGLFTVQGDIQYAQMSFQDLLDGAGKGFTGGTGQGVAVGLGVY